MKTTTATETDFSREFKVTWKVDHASLQCKNGVYFIDEVEKGTKLKPKEDLNLIEEGEERFRVQEVLTLNELLEHATFNSIAQFIMSEILNIDTSLKIDDADLIDEYLQSEYDDETIFFYEREEYVNLITTLAYYPMHEKFSHQTLSILKKLGFTGKIIERKGLIS